MTHLEKTMETILFSAYERLCEQNNINSDSDRAFERYIDDAVEYILEDAGEHLNALCVAFAKDRGFEDDLLEKRR